MPKIASVAIDVKLNLDSAKRQVFDFGHTGGRIAGGKFEQGFTEHMRGAKTRLNSITTGIFTGIAAGLTTTVAGAFTSAASAVGSLGASIIKAGADAEKSRTSFTTFLGSADRANSVLRDLTKFAAETPFELPEVEKAARQLLAFGFNAEQLKPTLTAVGNLAAGTGTNFSELADIIGKAKTQGRLFAEDINQLTGRGIPIIGELAKQFGVAESEVKKLVEDGKVGFGNLEKAIQAMSAEGGRFEGLMSKLADTTGGKFTNLSDRITQSFRKIFENIQPAINAALDVAAAFFDGLQVDFKSINSLAKDFAGWLVEHKDEAKAVGAAIGNFITNSFKIVNSLAKDFSNFLKENPAILKGIGVAVDLIGKGYGVWKDAIANVVSLAKEIASIFGGIVGLIDKAVQASQRLGNSFSQWSQASAANIFGTGGGGGGTLRFPIPGGSATSNMVGNRGAFGAPRDYGRHSGQDYGYGVGTPVIAPFSGKITSVATDKGEYKLVLQGQLGGKSVTADLVHLSTANVGRGASVSAGQTLGTVGGNKGSWGSSGAHLHLGYKVDGKVVSPMDFNRMFGGGSGGEGEMFDPATGGGTALSSWLGGVRQRNNFSSGYASAAQSNALAKYAAINQTVERSQDYANRVSRLTEILDKTNASAKELRTNIRDGVIGSITEGLHSAIVGTKSLGEAALDILGNIASKLADLALNSIFGGSRGGGGIFGTLLGGLFGGGGGGFGISPVKLPIPSYAVGTDYVPQNQLAYLHKGEAVVPANRNTGSGQNIVNINLTNNGGDWDLNDAAEKIRRVVEAELLRQRRPGGMIY